MTTPPPSDWPTQVARPWPRAFSRSRRLLAWAPSEYSLRGLAESPCPSRSGATTVSRLARAGMTCFHVTELPAMPWTSSTTGRAPPVLYRHVVAVDRHMLQAHSASFVGFGAPRWATLPPRSSSRSRTSETKRDRCSPERVACERRPYIARADPTPGTTPRAGAFGAGRARDHQGAKRLSDASPGRGGVCPPGPGRRNQPPRRALRGAGSPMVCDDTCRGVPDLRRREQGLLTVDALDGVDHSRMPFSAGRE